MTRVRALWGRFAWGARLWTQEPLPQTADLPSVVLMGLPRERSLMGDERERGLIGVARERTLVPRGEQ